MIDTLYLSKKMKLEFYAYKSFLHFIFLPIRTLPATTAEITGDFRRLPASNDIPGQLSAQSIQRKLYIKIE
jgi:hypothetical protein